MAAAFRRGGVWGGQQTVARSGRNLTARHRISPAAHPPTRARLGSVTPQRRAFTVVLTLRVRKGLDAPETSATLPGASRDLTRSVRTTVEAPPTQEPAACAVPR